MIDRQLTSALYGYNNLMHLEFSVESITGECTLILDLGMMERPMENGIRVELQGVSELTLRGLGGGLTQLLLLNVEDISERQFDRLNYVVRELERESLGCFCRSISVCKLGEA